MDLTIKKLKLNKTEKLIMLINFFGNGFFDRALWIIYLISNGYSLVTIGILQSLLNFSMFVTEIPTGIFSDRYGRKKSLIIGRIFIILYYVTILFFSKNIIILICGFIVYGVGLSFISCSDQALLYDFIQENNIESESTKILGRYSACITIALAISMGIGGVLQRISWNIVYEITIVFQIISLIITSFLKESINTNKESVIKGKESSIIFRITNELKSFIKLDKGLKLLIFGIAIYQGFISLYYMFSQQLFNGNNYSVMAISIIYSIENFISAILYTNAYRLEKNFNISIILKQILIITFISISLLFFKVKIFYLIAFFIISSAYSIFTPIIYTMINKNIASSNRATILSILSFFATLIMFVLSPILGKIADKFGINIILAICGCIFTLITLLSLKKFFKKNYI